MCNFSTYCPLFKCILHSGSQAFWSHLRRKFLGSDRGHVCTASLTSSSVASICPCKSSVSHPNMWSADGPSPWLHGGFGRSSYFICQSASVATATKCRQALLWSKRTPLDSKPLRLLWTTGFICLNAFLPQRTDHSLLFYSSSILNLCCHL